MRPFRSRTISPDFLDSHRLSPTGINWGGSWGAEGMVVMVVVWMCYWFLKSVCDVMWYGGM
jgi:hypothetical protein